LPKKRRNIKTVTLNIRISPHIKRLIDQVAFSEGMATSEWVRNLIVNDLRKRGVLHRILTPPSIEGEEA